MTECRHRRLAGLGAADVDHQEAQRASERRVRAITGTEHVEACVHADPCADRTVHDHQWRRDVGRSRHAVQIEVRITRAFDRREQDGHIFRRQPAITAFAAAFSMVTRCRTPTSQT